MARFLIAFRRTFSVIPTHVRHNAIIPGRYEVLGRSTKTAASRGCTSRSSDDKQGIEVDHLSSQLAARSLRPCSYEFDTSA